MHTRLRLSLEKTKDAFKQSILNQDGNTKSEESQDPEASAVDTENIKTWQAFICRNDYAGAQSSDGKESSTQFPDGKNHGALRSPDGLLTHHNFSVLILRNSGISPEGVTSQYIPRYLI
ncbi:hypothetical protein PGTUg99_012733 [Puccinia graminis f. sp. tritici]|uniref:Uncharacterized protein n=1 Tax=Puccinia graminis f. sp. tritici TaxID=56615 RepID=A0A5B0NZX3_PUCGR|nr:hypothetical protein PGTUg99_012733 [Puccinia graminis f. sp. tritici]